MCVITHFYNEETNKVHSGFFGLIEVPRADTETLFQGLCHHFERLNFPFTNVIEYAADEANTMMRSKKTKPHKFYGHLKLGGSHFISV